MNTGNGGYYDENMFHANNYTTFTGLSIQDDYSYLNI